jgi:hypothetical protein
MNRDVSTLQLHTEKDVSNEKSEESERRNKEKLMKNYYNVQKNKA